MARRDAWAVPAFLFVLALIVWAQPIFLDKTFLLRDHVSYVLPSRWHFAHALAAGHLPEWWNGLGLGAPFAANPNHGVFYPPVWLIAILPVRYAVDVLVISHLYLAGLGGAALAKRFGADRYGMALGGATLMLSGYAASMPPLCLAPLSFAYVPWLAWGADRLATSSDWRSRAICALQLAGLWAGHVLSGDPASLLDGGILVGMILLARSQGWRARLGAVISAAAALALAVVMASALILPSMTLLAGSQRAAGLSMADASVWPMRPFRALEVLWPRMFGNPQEPLGDFSTIFIGKGFGEQNERWVGSEYVGLVAIVLAIVAIVRRRVRGGAWLGAGAVLMLLLAMGLHTPLYALYLKIPFTHFIRYPEKHMTVFVVLIAALAGAGATELWQRHERLLRWVAIATAALSCLIGAAALVTWVRLDVVIAWMTKRATDTYETMHLVQNVEQAIATGLLAAGGGMLASIACAAAVTLAGEVRSRFLRATPYLFAAGMLVPALVNATLLQYVAPRARLRQRPAVAQGVPDATTPTTLPRVYRYDSTTGHGWTNEEIVFDTFDSLGPNMAYPYGFQAFPGYDPALDDRLDKLADTAKSDDALLRFLARFDIEYVVVPPAQVGNDNWKAMPTLAEAPGKDETLLHNLARRPRAFVAPRWDVLDDKSAPDALFKGEDDPGLIHLAPDVTAPITDSATTTGPIVPCTIGGTHPEDVLVTCEATAPGYAVLLDAWAPGWTATVDGVAAKIERADMVVRAVKIDAGKHVVAFHYETPSLRRALQISALGWGAWALGLLLFRFWRRRRRRSVPPQA